ncbi:TrlF family AAA-like ATPase [Olsenella sp. Marseille-QA0557]|uniref:TrlF family AAA-like ATPase n=1 Tax=Olsenella sp. Marseille-QA0557 TaxID=3378782 RepID=UPI003D0A7514
MNSKYGSEWRKWDLHVHTPYSVLNNQFHLHPENASDFDEYVTRLFSSAVEKGVCAIGITDYFSVEGYARIRKDYLGNPEAMKRLFPDEGLRNKVRSITVFPNVELRATNIISVNRGDARTDDFLDYHVIFSDQIDPEIIERNFLNRLSFTTVNPDEKLSLNRDNIIAFGKQIRALNGGRYEPYRTGLENITISFEDATEILSSCSAFSGSYLIAIPADETLPKIDWKGRGYTLRCSITRRANVFFSSSEKTREWASGGRSWNEEELGAPRPCIVASDAHDFDHLFEPECGKYCWIKADPTFEGLLQVLCEPVDRVAVQKDRPESLDPHRSIESLAFGDQLFQEEPIVFSDALTCIIGGRSTGKSMLLRNLAWAIAPEYAKKQERRSGSVEFKPAAGVKVTWRDHVPSEQRKIIYLPQTFLNRTVDDPESEDGTSGLIGDVLMQDEAVLESFQVLESERNRIRTQTNARIEDYFRTRRDFDGLRRIIIENGGHELFESVIQELENESSRLAESASATKEELEKYGHLTERKTEIEAKIVELENDSSAIASSTSPTLSEPQLRGMDLSLTLAPATADALRKVMNSLETALSGLWENEARRLVEDLSAQREKLVEELQSIENDLCALKPKVEQSVQLAKIMARLSDERRLLLEAKEREEGLRKLQSELNRLRGIILSSRSQYHDAYLTYCKSIGDLSGSFSTNLSFSAEPAWRFSDFAGSVLNNLNSRRFSQFDRVYGHNLSDLSYGDYTDELLSDIWLGLESMANDGSVLQLKSGISEEDFVRSLFSDWYNVHYIVTSDGDQLAHMSPGKKGLVLLELIIELERGNCPILIDQPEDDLDNRSIYSELRKFIKDSKKRRQIIVVTHNANIVLGADAEEVIVANQNGAEARNRSRKFEYRSGSIENNVVNRSDDAASEPYLSRFSIQDHICRTLEGGREALEQRRKKYGFSS